MSITTTSTLNLLDRWGSVKVRWGIKRNNYLVAPGLYSLGQPDGASPVLVSANYKLSFDVLRSSLPGLNAWILVLDTKGVNVWCAAGKGTFGTKELLHLLDLTQLATVVNHRTLILPQLSAPGISASEVKKRSGFTVDYGPVRAADLPEFIAQGFKASTAMRRVQFTLWDRLVLTPMELVQSLPPLLIITLTLALLSGNASTTIIAMVLAYLAGNVLTPVMLPWLPIRSFSGKGGVVGLGVAAGFLALTPGSLLPGFAWLLIIPAITSFLAMNFTGCSTYTSLSGVKKEMTVAIPLQAALFIVGSGILVFQRFF